VERVTGPLFLYWSHSLFDLSVDDMRVMYLFLLSSHLLFFLFSLEFFLIYVLDMLIFPLPRMFTNPTSLLVSSEYTDL